MKAKGVPKGQETEPKVVIQLDPVPEAALPDFGSAEDEPEPPPSTPSSSSTQPGQTPTPIAIKPIVDVLCGMFDRGVKGAVGAIPGAEKVPEPPEPITAEEKQQMAEAYGLLLDKYGGTWARYSVEINAVFVTLAVFGSRILAGRAYIQYENAKRKAVTQEVVEPDQGGAPYTAAQFGSSEDPLKEQGEAFLRAQEAREAAMRR